jgi:two-component system, NtrC family, response regulator AtoC
VGRIGGLRYPRLVGNGRDEEATATLTSTSMGSEGAAYLHVFTKTGAFVIPLPLSGELIIGRAGECNAKIDDPSVSRRHARIVVGDGLSLEDLGSHNGTRIEGVKLEPQARVPIGVGSVLEVGSVAVVLRQGKVTRAPADATGPMDQVEQLARLVAKSPLSLVLLGETGVGKTVFARRIHEWSGRASGPFVSTHFAAMPESLIESELFGHLRGAFTGANENRPGLIETAHGGTLFLDELGEVPPAVQTKLLRVVESAEVTRLGSTKPTRVDVRYISATNRDLKAAVAQGRFRADLYYRLDGLTISLPPLRERKDQVASLAKQFTEEASRDLNKPSSLAPDAVERLLAHSWPGNVRELRNVVTRSVLLCAAPVLHARDLRFEDAIVTTEAAAPPTLDREASDEKQRILDALQVCAGNQSRAAERLGMSRRTLVERLGRYGISRPRLKKP